MAGKRNRYAIVSNPTIEAIVSGMFAFKSEQQAVDQINAIKNNFIISKEQPCDTTKQVSVMLWIKGFDISLVEKDEGFTGNFALITYEKSEGDEERYTLKANKVESDVKYHPQRKREKLSHPNWGHPILRGVKKKKKYETIEEAQSELQKLHEEYPTVTIPNPGKLYVMIYAKAEKGQSPVKKYILEIQADKEGGFFIEYKENSFKGPAVEKKEEKPEEAPEGYFTSMLQAKRGKKPTKPAAEE